MIPLLLACAAPPGPTLRADFADPAFWSAPWPALGRGVEAFPNPEGVRLVEQLRALAPEGAGRTSAVFFSAEAPLDPASLPGLAQSVTADSAVFLVDVDPGSPSYGERVPLLVRTLPEGTDFADPDLLVLLPLQGVPLRAGTRYAAGVTRAVRTAAGQALGPSPLVAALQRREDPPGLTHPAAWRAALDALEALGVDPAELAGLTVFQTGHPEDELLLLREAAPALKPPRALALTEVYAGYCVLEGRVELPVYQQGEPPYTTEGGGITLHNGVPVLDRWEQARVLFTVPRGVAGPLPTAVFIRTGGGGDRPLVDRGVRDATGQAEPGSGPAAWLAELGWAGVSIDGPHGGLRNPTGGDEQFLMFNIQNPTALRDNVRQSALELALLPALLDGLVLDATACPGVEGPVALGGPMALLGHSMGATLAPLTLALAPEYSRVVLSGAGGSWIHNVVYKQSPLEVRPLAEAMLGYDSGELSEWDPVLSLLQWVGEAADPPVYATLALDPPREVLMVQGIVDTYILPPIANTTSLSLGLDLLGPALDEGHPELEGMSPLSELLPRVGGQRLDYPAAGNRDGYTRVVTQHAEDGVEDGHEVFYQLAAPPCQAQALLAGEAIPSCGAAR